MANKAGLQLKQMHDLYLVNSTLSKFQIKTQRITKHSWKIQLCTFSTEIRCPDVNKMTKKFAHFRINPSAQKFELVHQFTVSFVLK